MTALRDALDAYKPEIAARYGALVRGQFNRMVEAFGPDLRGIHNSTLAGAFAGTVRPNVAQRSERGIVKPGTPYVIDGAKLAVNASAYADAVVDAWEGKIAAKMGELEGATVARLGGCAFLIVGTRGGKAVRIEQQMIVNVSAKGTPFNQFPARIYVEGKFTSEAAYKRAA